MIFIDSIPPAGGTPSIFELIKYRKTALLYELGRYYPNRNFRFGASGKNALETAFNLHQNNEVLIPGYTCPDIICAALKANKTIHLCDVDPETLKPIINSNEKLFVATNPFGFIDLLPNNLEFIDDGCQAGLAEHESQRIGARGFAGVLSFGRGKAYAGVGGGVLISKNPLDFEKPSIINPFKDYLVGALTNLFEKSPLYFIPSQLAFLKLGQTEVKLDYDFGPIYSGQVEYAKASVLLSPKRFEYSNLLTKFYLEHLPSSILFNNEYRGMNRFPIRIANSSQRDEISQGLANLGVSKSYPCSLEVYPEFNGKFKTEYLKGANEIARTILTLPLHLNVKLKHQKLIVEFINKII